MSVHIERYLFEYGPLKRYNDIYPQNFFFERKQQFLRRASLAIDQIDIAVISLGDAEDVQIYQERFGIAAGESLSHLLIRE